MRELLTNYLHAQAIDVDPASLMPLTFASHPYESFHLLMPLFSSVDGWSGEPMGAEGQALAWVDAATLDSYDVPPADVPLVPSVRDFLVASTS